MRCGVTVVPSTQSSSQPNKRFSIPQLYAGWRSLKHPSHRNCGRAKSSCQTQSKAKGLILLNLIPVSNKTSYSRRARSSSPNENILACDANSPTQTVYSHGAEEVEWLANLGRDSGGNFQATFARTSDRQPSCNLLSALNHEELIRTVAGPTTATIRTHSLSDGECQSTATQKPSDRAEGVVHDFSKKLIAGQKLDNLC
jgi:hypothetical protein